jgi:integrase
LSIGVSVDFFDEHVRPELRVVRRGRKVLVPVLELERWLDREASRVVGEVDRRGAPGVREFGWTSPVRVRMIDGQQKMPRRGGNRPGPAQEGSAPTQEESCQSAAPTPGSARNRIDGPSSSPPRRVRVAEGVYQRIDRKTGKPVPGSFEFSFRDSTGRQWWQRAKGETKALAKAERAQLLARMHKGERVERSGLTVSEAARLWLERATGPQGRWAESTRERYEWIVRLDIDASTDLTTRPIGTDKLRELTVDRVAAWSLANERHLAPSTARIALIVLNQICRFAVRNGWLASNPVGKLEPGEKPRLRPKEVAILEGDLLARFLAHAGPRRPLFQLLAYTGLRIGEALGLTWADVDYDNGTIRVHRQLTRHRIHGPLKTPAGKREVILAPAIAKLLRERWLASSFKAPHHLVFCNPAGRGLDRRDVGEDFRATLKRARIDTPGKRLTLHSLRHAYASLLIGNGLNVVFVSRQLGHANPNITLGVYAHLFAQRDHAQAAREALEESLTASNGRERNTRLW